MKKLSIATTLYLAIMCFIRLPFWQPIDESIALFFIAHRTPALTQFFDLFTHLASTKATIVIAIIMAAILFWKKRKEALPFASSVIMSAGIVTIIKNIVRRNRPAFDQLHTESSFSFPSGHSNAAFTVFGFMLILVYKYSNNKGTRSIATALCSIIILLIGISRLYLSVHWFTDIVGGFSTACFTLFFIQTVFIVE